MKLPPNGAGYIDTIFYVKFYSHKYKTLKTSTFQIIRVGMNQLN